LAVFLLTSGSLADRYGGRRVFLAGLVVFTGASVAFGVSGDIVMLSVSRGVQGVGAAVLYAVGPALTGREFVGRVRGSAFGISAAGSGLAIALGPLIGGALTRGARTSPAQALSRSAPVSSVALTVCRERPMWTVAVGWARRFNSQCGGCGVPQLDATTK
jgi:MFS family permease